MSFHQKRLKISVSLEVINTVENILASRIWALDENLDGLPDSSESYIINERNDILKEVSHIDRFGKAVKTARKRY